MYSPALKNFLKLLAHAIAIFLCQMLPVAVCDGAMNDSAPPWDLVIHNQVNAHWSEDGNSFWFRSHELNGKWRFYWVDALNGTKALAFDHAKVAALLGKVTGRDLDPDQLPIDGVEISGGVGSRTVIVDMDFTRWRINFEKQTVEKAPGNAAGGESLPMVPPTTPRTNPTSVEAMTFVNNLPNPVTASADGVDVLIPARSEVRNLSGDSTVWHLTDQNGRSLGSYVTPTGGGRICVDKTTVDRFTSTTKPANEGLHVEGGSPDGRYAAYAQNYNVFLRDLTSGQVFSLSTDGSIHDGYRSDNWLLAWSADSTYFRLCLKTPNLPIILHNDMEVGIYETTRAYG